MEIGMFRFRTIVYLAASVLSLLAAAVPAFAVDYIQGFDVYNGNGAVNWTTAKNGGYSFAFVKATEGVDFTDARFSTNMSGANAAGVNVGPYHFCRIDSKNGGAFTSYDGSAFAIGSDPWLDATSEAADFIQVIRPYYTAGNYLPPVADAERFPNFGSTSLNRTFISNWIQLFSDTVYNALGVRPIIYTGQSSANSNFTSAVAGAHKLWVAWWKGTGTTSPPVPANTPSWPPWTFWQWSDGSDAIALASPVPGTSGQIDRDVFYGTAAQLSALLVRNAPGDYNHNGEVDAADYALYRNLAGSTINLFLAADGNNNQALDAGDYTYWRARFGQAAGSGAGESLDVSGVPEPATMLLAVMAGLAVSFRRRVRF
jgi:GH25 family lysozyme M1 (1,4-beta-N-acetylmuramidase)